MKEVITEEMKAVEETEVEVKVVENEEVEKPISLVICLDDRKTEAFNEVKFEEGDINLIRFNPVYVKGADLGKVVNDPDGLSTDADILLKNILEIQNIIANALSGEKEFLDFSRMSIIKTDLGQRVVRNGVIKKAIPELSTILHDKFIDSRLKELLGETRGKIESNIDTTYRDIAFTIYHGNRESVKAITSVVLVEYTDDDYKFNIDVISASSKDIGYLWAKNPADVYNSVYRLMDESDEVDFEDPLECLGSAY